MIRMSGLNVGYGRSMVIKDLELTVPDGSRLGIIGPNGCGKTTLLHAVCGILPYSGSIKIDGGEIKALKRRELSKRVALLSQSVNIPYSYTVYDTIKMGRFVYGGKDGEGIIDDLISRLGLGGILHRPITALSGGQLQRVLLARAFAQEPKLLLLDEPTNHLDIISQMELCDMLDDWLGQDSSRSVIGVIHELGLLPRFFKDAVLLDGGRIVLSNSSADIIKSSELNRTFGSGDRNIAEFLRDSFKLIM